MAFRIGLRQAPARKVIDDAARSVARRGKRLIRSVRAGAEVGARPVRPRHQHRLPRLAENRVAGHSRCRIRAHAVVTMDNRFLPADHLLVDRVMRGVDDQPAGAAEGIERHPAQGRVRAQAEGEAVVHRRRIRNHQALALGAIPRDGWAVVGEIERVAIAQLLQRPCAREVMQRLLQPHDPLEHPVPALA